MIAGAIATSLLIGTLIYKFDDIRQEIRYRNLWKEHGI